MGMRKGAQQSAARTNHPQTDESYPTCGTEERVQLIRFVKLNLADRRLCKIRGQNNYCR